MNDEVSVGAGKGAPSSKKVYISACRFAAVLIDNKHYIIPLKVLTFYIKSATIKEKKE